MRFLGKPLASVLVLSALAIAACGTSGSETEPSESRAGAGGDGTATGGSGPSTASGGLRDSPRGGSGGGRTSCTDSCDDGFTCTLDTCRANGSCSHTIGPNEGLTACPRGSYCTVEDGCVKPPACATDLDCEEALGDDPCRSNLHCDPSSSLCLFDTLDKDRDGHSPPICGGDDCDDADPEVFPGSPERCNSVDDDCDGETDEGQNACDLGGPADCIAGACVCRPENACDGVCVDFETDHEHCGDCNEACGTHETCVEGACACPDGLVCGTLLREYGFEHFYPLLAHQGYVTGMRGPNVVAVTPDGSDERWISEATAWEIQASGDDLFVVGDLGFDAIFQIPFLNALEDGPVVGRTIFTEAGAPSPAHLVLHDERLYWINTRRDVAISSARQADENVMPETLGSLTCALLAGDDESLYCITNDVPASLYAVSYEDGSERLIHEGIPCAENLRVSGGYAYWSEPCEYVVARVDLNGGELEELDHEPSTGVVATSIIPDGNRLYIWDAFGFGVMPSIGGSFLRIARGVVFGVVIDGDSVYWSAPEGLYRARKPR